MHKLLSSLLLTLALGASHKAVGAGFELQTYLSHPPEMGCLTNHVLVIGANRINFVVPNGWSMRFDPNSASLMLSEPNSTDLITITLLDGAGDPSEDSLRENLLKRFEGAAIVNTGQCYAEGGKGRFWDLDWISASHQKHKLRFARLTLEGIPLEIALITKSDRLNQVIGPYQALLTSFQPFANIER
jgi:hypothetical protein